MAAAAAAEGRQADLGSVKVNLNNVDLVQERAVNEISTGLCHRVLRAYQGSNLGK